MDKLDTGLQMRFGALSAAAFSLMVAACADQHAQPVATVQLEHSYSTAAALSSDGRTAPTSSMSDSMPNIDVAQVCQGIAEQGGVTFHDPEIARTKKDCLDSERLVRNELSKIWENFAASDRTHCMIESKMGGQSSYTELLTCLEMARDARKLHEEAAGARQAQTIGQR